MTAAQLSRSHASSSTVRCGREMSVGKAIDGLIGAVFLTDGRLSVDGPLAEVRGRKAQIVCCREGSLGKDG